MQTVTKDKEYKLEIIPGSTPLASGNPPFNFVTSKVYIFMVPASVYGTYQPNASGTGQMQGKFFDLSNSAEPVVLESMQKYLIEVTLDL